jgi:hypothetical protein
VPGLAYQEPALRCYAILSGYAAAALPMMLLLAEGCAAAPAGAPTPPPSHGCDLVRVVKFLARRLFLPWRLLRNALGLLADVIAVAALFGVVAFQRWSVRPYGSVEERHSLL